MAYDHKKAGQMASKLVQEVLRAPGRKRMGEMLKPPAPVETEPPSGENEVDLSAEDMAHLEELLKKKG
jgi:hypothetical protein